MRIQLSKRLLIALGKPVRGGGPISDSSNRIVDNFREFGTLCQELFNNCLLVLFRIRNRGDATIVYRKK